MSYCPSIRCVGAAAGATCYTLPPGTYYSDYLYWLPAQGRWVANTPVADVGALHLGSNAGSEGLGGHSVILGEVAQGLASGSVAVGYAATAPLTRSVAVGPPSDVTTPTLANLSKTQAYGTGSVAVGSGAATGFPDATVVDAEGAVAVGLGAAARLEDSIAIGNGAVASTSDATATRGIPMYAIAIGAGSTATAESSDDISTNGPIALGRTATATTGTSGTTTSTSDAIAIGDGAAATAPSTGGQVLAIGAGSQASAASTIAIGAGSQATVTGGLVLGVGSNVNLVRNGIIVGHGSSLAGSSLAGGVVINGTSTPFTGVNGGVCVKPMNPLLSSATFVASVPNPLGAGANTFYPVFYNPASGELQYVEQD
jgi:trimeric autotransporter adhesin